MKNFIEKLEDAMIMRFPKIIIQKKESPSEIHDGMRFELISSVGKFDCVCSIDYFGPEKDEGTINCRSWVIGNKRNFSLSGIYHKRSTSDDLIHLIINQCLFFFSA